MNCIITFQYLKVHLEFLQFLLKEGDIYLAWPRCKDIWDTLVANPKASGYDKEVSTVCQYCNTWPTIRQKRHCSFQFVTVFFKKKML